MLDPARVQELRTDIPVVRGEVVVMGISRDHCVIQRLAWIQRDHVIPPGLGFSDQSFVQRHYPITHVPWVGSLELGLKGIELVQQRRARLRLDLRDRPVDAETLLSVNVTSLLLVVRRCLGGLS